MIIKLCKNCSKVFGASYNGKEYCSSYCKAYDKKDIVLSKGYKHCSHCKKEKSLDYFSINKRVQTGYNSRCKKCNNESSNKSEYRQRANKKTRERMQNDPEYREHKLSLRRKNERNRYANDPKYKINQEMRGWMNRCLLNINTYEHCESVVDYTKDELRSHFENLLKDGMSWSNYGQWEVDHIKPRSSFNYTSPEDPAFKECWSLSNLQPLWAEDNLSKSSK